MQFDTQNLLTLRMVIRLLRKLVENVMNGVINMLEWISVFWYITFVGYASLLDVIKTCISSFFYKFGKTVEEPFT